ELVPGISGVREGERRAVRTHLRAQNHVACREVPAGRGNPPSIRQENAVPVTTGYDHFLARERMLHAGRMKLGPGRAADEQEAGENDGETFHGAPRGPMVDAARCARVTELFRTLRKYEPCQTAESRTSQPGGGEDGSVRDQSLGQLRFLSRNRDSRV